MVENAVAEMSAPEPINDLIYEQASKIENSEELNKFIMDNDPRNHVENFLHRYNLWALNPTKDLKHISLQSRLRTIFGSVFYGTPSSLGMPHYFYYNDKDKILCSPFHYNTKTIDDYDVSRFILYTNRFAHNFRKAAVNKICLGFLAFSFLAGLTQYGVVKTGDLVGQAKGYFEQKANVKLSKQQQIDNLVTQGKQLIAQRTSNEITAEKFNERVKALQAQEQQINAQGQ